MRKEYEGTGPSGQVFKYRKLSTPEWFEIIKAMPTLSYGKDGVQEAISAEYWDRKLEYYRKVVSLGCVSPEGAFDDLEHADTTWLVEQITEISGLAGGKADQAESFRTEP